MKEDNLKPRRDAMRKIRWVAWACLAAVLLVASGSTRGGGSDKDAKLDFRVVKWDGLEKLLAELKGKVVVIDYWQDT
jgi:hypothetical protein